MSPQRFDELVSDALDLIPAGPGRGDRQRRRAGRGPQPGGTRPVRPVSRHRADRTRLLVRRFATRHDHDLPRRPAGHLRDRGRGGRRGGRSPSSTRSPITSASTTTDCTNSAGRKRARQPRFVRSWCYERAMDATAAGVEPLWSTATAPSSTTRCSGRSAPRTTASPPRWCTRSSSTARRSAAPALSPSGRPTARRPRPGERRAPDRTAGPRAPVQTAPASVRDRRQHN